MLFYLRYVVCIYWKWSFCWTNDEFIVKRDFREHLNYYKIASKLSEQKKLSFENLIKKNI